MSNQSITNKLIANINKTTNTNQYFNINSNIICIDTQNNRLGINTKTPQYSIDISGTNISNSIRATKFIGDISSNDICCNNVDASYIESNFGRIRTISADYIDVSDIDIKNLSLNTLDISSIVSNSGEFIELSCNNLTLFGNLDFCGNNQIIDFTNINLEFPSDLSFTKITVKKDNNNNNNLTTINGEYIDTSFITCTDLSSSRTIIGNNLSILSNATFHGDVSFNNGFSVSGEALFDGSAVFLQDISVNGTADFNQIRCDRYENFAGGTVISVSGDNISIGNLDCSYLTVHFDTSINGILDVSNLKVNYLLDTSALLLPDSSNNLSNERLIYLDKTDINTSLNKLNIGTTNNYNIKLQKVYCHLDLSDNALGNNPSYNSTTNSWFINNASNLDISYQSNTYKYVPFKLNTSQVITISNNKFIDLSNIEINLNNDIFDIHANICLRFLNRVPGDVEPNYYEFGLYKYDTNGQGQITDSNNYPKTKNTIMVFDNSYNYANSSINYIGNVDQKLAFAINSPKDLSFIKIENFSATLNRIA